MNLFRQSVYYTIIIVGSLVLAGFSTRSNGQDAIQFTAAQVADGEAIYKETCQLCHGNRLSNGQFGTPLKGSFFRNNWKGKTLGELVLHTYNEMPPDNKQSLSMQQYANVVAFILSNNDIAPGDTAMSPDTDSLSLIPLPWQ